MNIARDLNWLFSILLCNNDLHHFSVGSLVWCQLYNNDWSTLHRNFLLSLLQWRVNGAAGSNAALQRNQFTVNWQKTSAPGAISFIDTGGTLMWTVIWETLAVKLFHHSFGCLQLIKEFHSIRNATFNESARSTWCSVVKGRIGSKNSNIDENVHQANPRMANNFLRARFGIWLNFEEPNIDWGCRQTVDFSDTIIYVET